MPFIITPYYCIIGGWVTKYTAAYLVNGPEALADGGDFFTGFITSNAESYIWMLVFMAIVFVIVGLGREGRYREGEPVHDGRAHHHGRRHRHLHAHHAGCCGGRAVTTSRRTSASSRRSS